MKKFIKFISIITLIFSIIFLGCNKKSDTKTQKISDNKAYNQTTITATFYPLYIMLLNITDGIPDVKVQLLAPATTGCLHDYALTTKDMKTIQSTDILVANGAGMEDFLEKALAIKINRTIIASEGFELKDENAHVWVSPVGAAWEVQKIAEGLCRMDSNHTQEYTKNSMSYITQLYMLNNRMHSELDIFQGSKIVTFHEAFPYFAEEFNLNQIAIIEREPGTVPNAKELNQTIKTLKDIMQTGVSPALFAEPQYSSKSAEIIAKETGLKIAVLDPCVTGPLTKSAYITAMEKNLSVLKENLSK